MSSEVDWFEPSTKSDHLYWDESAHQWRRMVTIPRETARVLYDLIVGSLDWGSGFLETDEMRQVQTLALALGDVPLVRCRYNDGKGTTPQRDRGRRGAHGYGNCILSMGHDGAHFPERWEYCVIEHQGSALGAANLKTWWARRDTMPVRPSYKSLA